MKRRGEGLAGQLTSQLTNWPVDKSIDRQDGGWGLTDWMACWLLLCLSPPRGPLI